jgi:hypothetical protein
MDEEIPGLGTYAVPGFGWRYAADARELGTGELAEPGTGYIRRAPPGTTAASRPGRTGSAEQMFGAK